MKPLLPTETNCKCCSHVAELYGVCDFSKRTDDGDSGVLSSKAAGIPIYYYRCGSCGFVFSRQFDHFTHEDFAKKIYNEEYSLIDPEHLEKRPKANARLIKNFFSAYKDELRILDYGGGTGVLCRELEKDGFKAIETYDPFLNKNHSKPTGRFNLILCLEVFEHIVDPYQTLSEMASFLEEHTGLLILSTLIQPENIDQIKTNWWYICPRNAHISIHTQLSLQIVFKRVGMHYMTANQDLHCAFRNLPYFAKHLIR